VDIETVFGVKWPLASYPELLIIAGVVIATISFLLTIRFYLSYKKRSIHDQQLFLFRMKKIGLSNFQIKILQNMVDMLGLSNPIDLLNSPDLFEKAVGRFLSFLQSRGENLDSLAGICKDITIIHDKLYHPPVIKKPLSSADDISNDQLIYLVTEEENVHIGKVGSRDQNYIYINLFRPSRDIKDLGESLPVTAHLWRVGDAEYEFATTLGKGTKSEITLSLPDKIIRASEFRHPYIDVIIPAFIYPAEKIEEVEKANCTIFKLNDFEAVIRLDKKIDFQVKYNIEFTIMDFNLNLASSIISGKTIEEGTAFYYTLKFSEMSDAARQVLKKYVYEHL
jgi:c-di-GMP-binding flagellar brake protein YcgR